MVGEDNYAWVDPRYYDYTGKRKSNITENGKDELGEELKDTFRRHNSEKVMLRRKIKRKKCKCKKK